MILDVLVAYGRSNEAIIRRFIETIIKIEPKYQQDLTDALAHIGTVFETIQTKINENDNDTLDDLALYTLDCAYTIHTLLLVFSDAHDICINVKLEQRVTHFYDNAIPLLHKNISMINSNSSALRFLNYARIELIGFFRQIVSKYLNEILTQS